MRPYLVWYVGGIIALICTNWLSVTIPLYLAEGIDALAEGGSGPATTYETARIVALMGVIVIGVRTASRVLFFTPGRLIEAQVKRDLFDRVIRHQPVFLRQWATGDLFSRIGSDVNMLRLIGGFGVLQIANTVIALLLAGTQMLRISTSLAIYVVIPLAIGMFITQLFMRQMFLLMRKLQIEMAALSDHALASYQGVATIQGFAAEDAFQEEFEARNASYLATSLERANIRALTWPVLGFVASVNVFVLIWIGGPQAIAGDLTIGELVAFITLVNFVTIPMRATSFLLQLVKQAQAALERIEAILLPEPDRPEGTAGKPGPTSPPGLELRNLRFAYPDASGEERALDGITLTVPPGSTLGILGLTGSGKTTLLHTISRLYNPPRGTVFVDGVDLLDLDLDDWRRSLTYVTQRPFLFSETLASNILLGEEDPERLSLALTRAALDTDVAALPDGVHTEVGESGVRLSGGQRQRAALARGLDRTHSVLLLDDVLSAVDHHTEHQLLENLQNATSGSTPPTTLLVAHRVSALQQADQVVVLEDGALHDLGTPAELMARPGLFRDTWEQQQQPEDAT